MILLVDNYDSFTYNLRDSLSRFREVRVVRNDDTSIYQEAEKADALVFSPGPGWPADAGEMEKLIQTFAEKKPILGICLGHQAIAEIFGGTISLAPTVMHGKQSTLKMVTASPLYKGMTGEQIVMRYHSLSIEKMPDDFEVIARSQKDDVIMAIQHQTLPIYGVQYHPESIGTEHGNQLLYNFLNLLPS